MPPAARVGEPTSHTATPVPPGTPTRLLIGGQVLIDGLPAARRGDETACGATISGGALNVIIGG